MNLLASTAHQPHHAKPIRDERASSKVFIVGHPNVGKTSLFNLLTNSNQKVVNYLGSTVNTASKSVDFTHEDRLARLEFIDTPGMSSVTPASKDEVLTWQSLSEGAKPGDLLLFVIDPMQLGKQLVLFKQVEKVYPGSVAIALNYGCATSPIQRINAQLLSKLASAPVLSIEAKSRSSLNTFKKDLMEIVTKAKERKRPVLMSHRAFSTVPQTHGLSLPSEKELQQYYSWAEGVVHKLQPVEPEPKKKKESVLDRLMLHPIFGIITFIVLMATFFWTLFGAATPFMEFIESSMAALQFYLSVNMPKVFFTSLLVDGILSGVSAVLVFVPQIFILFFGMGIMEQSGFLSRGAIIIDKPLSKVGLSGKSFLPLLSGFACSIPAFMASRSIPSKRERLLVQLLIPLMTCSARLPVYGLLVSLLLIKSSALSKGIAMSAIYMASIVLSAVFSLLLSKLNKKQLLDKKLFCIELPAWRVPSAKEVLSNSLKKAYAFIKGAGPHILWISVALWIFSSYPTEENSYVIALGKFIEPVFAPMGIDWRVAVALIFAFAAREVFVPALVLIFSFHASDELTTGVLNTLKTATLESTGTYIFTPSTVLGLIGFFMISLQCLSTIAVARSEMGGWRRPLGMLIGYTLAGYLFSILLVQGSRIFGLS